MKTESKAKRIVGNNVRAVIPIEGGVLVLSGLAHLTEDFGNAFIFSNPDGLDIALHHTVHLDGEPSAYAKQPDGSVLFVTKGLCRITQSGELRNLTYFPDANVCFETPSRIQRIHRRVAAPQCVSKFLCKAIRLRL
jgi:hypothetical protein